MFTSVRATDPLPYALSWLGNRPPVKVRPSEPEMRALLSRADAEGLGGIVAEELQRTSSVRPPWLLERLHGWFLSGARHLALLRELGRQLAQQGLEVLALKGAALIPTAYSGRISCRPVSDLDLLVLEEQEVPVKALGATAVEQMGGGTVIDWHRSLVNDHRLPSRQYLLCLKPGEIWSMSEPFEPGIRHLQPELQFIHLALHSFKHSNCRLIWLVDQALAWRACDPERLLQTAHRVGAERPVLVSLHLLSRLLGEDVPQNSLKKLTWHEQLALWLTTWRGHEIGWGELFLILSVRGVKKKMRYLCEYLFPGPGVLGEEGNRFQATVRRAWRFLRNKNRTRG